MANPELLCLSEVGAGEASLVSSTSAGGYASCRSSFLAATYPTRHVNMEAQDHAQAAQVWHSASNEAPAVSEIQDVVLGILSGLGPMASCLCCVLAQPELTSKPLAEMGFMTTFAINPSTERLLADRDLPEDAQALLLVTLVDSESQTESLLRAVRSLNDNPDCPLLIVVMVVSDAGGEDLQASCLAKGRALAEVRRDLFSAGADEVMLQFGGEVVGATRVLEVIHKSEILAKKVDELITQEVRVSEEKAAKKLQVAYRRFLMDLCGHALDAIPPEDESLEEHTNEAGVLQGVGEYRFKATLGTGSFGSVFLCDCPTSQGRVMKVIMKSSVNNATVLLALDRELQIMRHLQAHPNVVKAFAVMNTKRHICCVMEYAGQLNLHGFTKVMLQRTNTKCLPDHLVQAFSQQQAVGVAHLHSALVCHRDLKPGNWVVSDSADTLRLTDFGFAAQLTAADQLLKQACGSLPFCAPEVYCRGHHCARDVSRPGYNGLACDCWSLGLCFFELAIGGLYSVEGLLQWLSCKPRREDQVLRDLRRLDTLWAEMPKAKVQGGKGLTELISKLLVVDPEQRLSAGQVVAGLGLALEAKPPRGGPRKQFSRSTSNVEHKASETPLVERLGGEHIARQVLLWALDMFLFSPGFGSALSAFPARTAALRTLLSNQMPKLLDASADGGVWDEVRAELRKVYSGLNVGAPHFRMLLASIAAALRHHGAPARESAEVVEVLGTLEEDITADFRERAGAAKRRNTPDWRAGVHAEVKGGLAGAFAIGLTSAVARNSILRDLAFANMSAEFVKSHMLSYLGSETREYQGPLAMPQSFSCEPGRDGVGHKGHPELSGVAHLVLIDLACSALATAAWAPEVVEVLHFAMLEDWERLHRSPAC